MSKPIHPIQANILKELLLKESARFTEINSEQISSDQFTFHLKQLIETGIIEKNGDGNYKLTVSGKEYANRHDIDSQEVKLEKQAKLTVLVIPTRINSGKREYAMQTRLKQPFYGYRGFVTGKIKYGETAVDAAERELLEEMGLRGNLIQKTVYHERIYSTEQKLLEDKYFFLFLADNADGELIREYPGGKSDWVAEDDCLKGNVFYDISDLLKLTQQNSTEFLEKSYAVENF